MKRTGTTTGFTLVEVSISSAILGVLAMTAVGILGTAQKGYGSSEVRTTLEDRTRIALKEIGRELACTGIACPDWSLSKSEVHYRRAAGYDFAADGLRWDNIRKFRLSGTKLLFEETSSQGGLVFSRTLLDPVNTFEIAQDPQDPALLTITLDLRGTDTQGWTVDVRRTGLVFLRN